MTGQACLLTSIPLHGPVQCTGRAPAEPDQGRCAGAAQQQCCNSPCAECRMKVSHHSHSLTSEQCQPLKAFSSRPVHICVPSLGASVLQCKCRLSPERYAVIAGDNELPASEEAAERSRECRRWRMMVSGRWLQRATMQPAARKEAGQAGSLGSGCCPAGCPSR